MTRIGQKNLFICLNDKVSALPLVQFVELLQKAHPQQQFKVLVDEKQKSDFIGLEKDFLIFLSKENFASSSPFSNQILCNMKSIDAQMKAVEDMGFDKVFQLGPIQWGRWMLSDLNHKVIALPLPEELSPWSVMNMLCQYFSLSPKTEKKKECKVLLHPYGLDGLDWHFLARLKEVDACKYPWLVLAIHERDQADFRNYESALPIVFFKNDEDLLSQEGQIVSLEERWGSLTSLFAQPCGWITEAGEREKFSAFYPNSFMMKINSEDFSPQEFLTALGYWRAGRLSELAFLNIQSHLQIECIQVVGEGLSLSAVSQNFEEYHLIKKILFAYNETSHPEDQNQSSGKVLDYLKSYRFEKYLLYSSLKSLKYVVEMMLKAHKKGERTFKELSNDFYKISIADEVFEALLSQTPSLGDKNIYFNKLNKLLNFLQTLEYSGETLVEETLEIS